VVKAGDLEHAPREQKLSRGPLLEMPSDYGYLVSLCTKAYHIHKGLKPLLDLARNPDENYSESHTSRVGEAWDVGLTACI
jgi:hypothetical protein